jgi:glycosyltransferase involved in cell wall biosynthesis
MLDPTVSVVIPTYNREKILIKSVQSVLNQTYEDFELIIVDDASTDDTDQVVSTFDDSRIEYIKHDENRGAPAARNTGIESSDGEFISFQDSDDEWDPRKLEKQMRVFEQSPPDVGVVYTGMIRKREDKKVYIPYSSVEQKEGDIRHSLARQNFIPTQVATVRRKCFEEVSTFDGNCWPISDWELWIRISKQFQFKLVDEALVTGEVRPDSISKDTRTKVESRERIVNKHQSFFNNASLARQLFYIGHGFMKLGETRSGRAYLIRAVKVKPDVRNVGALLLSLLGSNVYGGLYRYYKQNSSLLPALVTD